jgi:hypothetical protein
MDSETRVTRGPAGHSSVMASRPSPPLPSWWLPFVLSWYVGGAALILFGALHFTGTVNAGKGYGVLWCIAGLLLFSCGVRISMALRARRVREAEPR